jgi:hypothetical protein
MEALEAGLEVVDLEAVCSEAASSEAEEGAALGSS